MRICDLVAKFVYDSGVGHVFMVSGGGLMFLTDGLACNKNLQVVCCHHEQAASMAATAYAKYQGFGCAYLTTGCGGTNAVTGVLHAWQDNTPVLFISGQCKRRETIACKSVPLRQMGVQEADIVSIVKSITKYAVMVEDENDILYHLEKAVYLAKSGRPGPVWLDIPMDIQSALVDEDSLRHFDVNQEHGILKTLCTKEELEAVAQSFCDAERPIVVAGQGIRLSNTIDAFEKFVTKHKIPFVCSRLGLDILPTENPYNIGRIGNKGMRSANFALQNADLVLVLGSRLSVSSTGQEYKYFAREAKVIVIDIDPYEHKKQTVHIEKEINADLRDFFKKLVLPEKLVFTGWANHCAQWKEKYPVFLPEYNDTQNGINMYLFMEELSKCLKDDSAIVTDAGSAVYVPPQGIKTTSKHQRYITSGGQAEMGFTLPGTIGVCCAKGKTDVIGITGDGSFQMNLQEMQTLFHYKLPIKLFIWNNDGYLSIRATQHKFFEGRYIGTDATSGVSFPSIEKLCIAYDLTYFKLSPDVNIQESIETVLSTPGPVICEVLCERDQAVQPNVGSRILENGRLVSSPIEDMMPFLPREEFLANMIVKPVSDK